MTSAWLRKELREHGWALAVWALFGVAVFALLVWILSTEEARGSWFEATRRFTVAWSIFGITWLAGRLIRREYASRTQLFLEALPISRGRVLTVKWALGAGLSAGAVLAAIAATAVLARDTQLLEPRLLGFITVRLVSLSLFAWALLAMAAVMGRYRVPLLLFLAIALSLLAQFTDLDLTNEGPMRLFGADLPYEQRALPLSALVATWIAIAICVATTYAFVLARDGALTVLLSDRMSHREKVYVSCVLLAFSVGVGTLGEAKTPEPFRLENPLVAEVGPTRVELAWERDLDPERAEAIAQRLAEAADAAREYLGLERVATLSLVPTRELDPTEMQSAYVSRASGSVMRANLAHPDLDLPRLTVLALHDVLSETHDDGAMREPIHWVLDGIAHLRGEEAARPERARELLWLRAAYARDLPPLEELLARWDLGDELRGSCINGALAATLLLTVEDLRGEEAVRRLARRALHDEAGSWRILRPPSPDVLIEEETGLTAAELEQAWRGALEAFRSTHPQAVAALPSIEASAELVRLAGKTFELRHSVRLSPPPGKPVRYSVRYTELGPFDLGVLEEELELHQALTGSEPVALPTAMIEGDRWLWMINVPIEALDCSVRPVAERRVIR